MSCPSCFLSPLHPLLLTRRCARIFRTSTQLHHLSKPSLSKGGVISAKLGQKRKAAKRAASAAGLASPPARRLQFHRPDQNTEDVSSGAMQNALLGAGQWPASRPPSFRDDERLWSVQYLPYQDDERLADDSLHAHPSMEPSTPPASASSSYPPGFGSQPFHPLPSIEQPTAPANASPPHHPGLGPDSFNPSPSIEISDTPEGSFNQMRRPMFGAATPLPSKPFPPSPAFPNPPPFNTSNNISWPPPDTQGSANLPAAPPMPHVNPRFFNPAMGSMLPPSFPTLPFNPLLQFQNAQPMSTLAGPPATPTQKPKRQRFATPPVEIPVPTKEYTQQASQKPKLRSHPQPLLIILDLNGTLIFRKHKKLPPSFAKRAGLDHFLDELAQKYSVMIWSSSKPATVGAICKKLFPDDKEDSIVAKWGRDKFNLTSAQYNSKLQVYKELHKVWADSQIQAAYPGSEPVSTKRSGGKFSKRNKNRQQNDLKSPPAGQRWDQTNTILIDDSKLKALSEPYNILEIPEFTGDLSIDESALFTNVLEKLDILSRHEDVSKMLRLVNELAEKEGKPILDMEFPFSEGGIPFDEEDVSDGGVRLVPPRKRKGNGKKTAAAKQAQTPTDTADGADVAAQKKAAKKARKQAKKEAKKAAQAGQTQQPAADQAASATQPANTATAVSTPAPEPEPATNPDGSVRLSRRQRRQQVLAARREARARAQQSAPAEPTEPDAPITAESRKSYNLRQRDSGLAIPVTEGDVDSSVAIESIDTVFDKQFDGYQLARSPSSASDSSRNSLLDRLEDGLGIHRY